jgi:hypothetical protein
MNKLFLVTTATAAFAIVAYAGDAIDQATRVANLQNLQESSIQRQQDITDHDARVDAANQDAARQRYEAEHASRAAIANHWRLFIGSKSTAYNHDGQAFRDKDGNAFEFDNTYVGPAMLSSEEPVAQPLSDADKARLKAEVMAERAPHKYREFKNGQ